MLNNDEISDNFQSQDIMLRSVKALLQFSLDDCFGIRNQLLSNPRFARAIMRIVSFGNLAGQVFVYLMFDATWAAAACRFDTS